MMLLKRVLAVALFLLAIQGTGTAGSAPIRPGPVPYPAINPWLQDSAKMAATQAFLTQPLPANTIIMGSVDATRRAANAAGYITETGGSPKFLACAVGDTQMTTVCDKSPAKALAYALTVVDGWAVQGATYVYFNEPDITFGDFTPCCPGQGQTGVYVVNTAQSVGSAVSPANLTATTENGTQVQITGYIVAVNAASPTTGALVVTGLQPGATWVAPIYKPSAPIGTTISGTDGNGVSVLVGTKIIGIDQYSIPYIVQGYNYMADYMHDKYPTMKMGFSIGTDPIQYKLMFDQAAQAVPGGFHMDFVQWEYYEVTCCDYKGLWSTFKLAYPNVLRFALVESIMTFCAFPDNESFQAGNVDVVGFWNADNWFHGWGYPTEEAGVLQFIQDYGASDFDFKKVCSQTYSRGTNVGWGHDTVLYPGGPGNVFNISDNHATYALSSCQYRVFSGPAEPDYGLNTLNGVDYLPGTLANGSAGWSVTRDWTARPCSGPAGYSRFSVNVGTPGGVGSYFISGSQNVGSAIAPVAMMATIGSKAQQIRAYIAGNVLVVVSGTFAPPLTVGTVISGPGVTPAIITDLPDCRNNKTTPITGYISNDILTIVSGNILNYPNDAIFNHGITGSDSNGRAVANGTLIKYLGLYQPGARIVNQSQNVGSATNLVNMTITNAAGTVSELAKGWIEGNVLVIAGLQSGSYIANDLTNATVTGTGIAPRTTITADAGEGKLGVYVLNQAQPVAIGSVSSPAKLFLNWAQFSCVVEVRALDNSPGTNPYNKGIGIGTYYPLNVFF